MRSKGRSKGQMGRVTLAAALVLAALSLTGCGSAGKFIGEGISAVSGFHGQVSPGHAEE